jgi:hypothetical protein
MTALPSDSNRSCALETVWSEIATGPGQVEVPQWQKDILDERDLALKEGRATVLEWDEAKRQIEQASRRTSQSR